MNANILSVWSQWWPLLIFLSVHSFFFPPFSQVLSFLMRVSYALGVHFVLFWRNHKIVSVFMSLFGLYAILNSRLVVWSGHQGCPWRKHNFRFHGNKTFAQNNYRRHILLRIDGRVHNETRPASSHINSQARHQTSRREFSGVSSEKSVWMDFVAK